MIPPSTGRVFIFSAPSGAGKTTLVHRILDAFPDFAFSVSATTRPRRNHEVDGRDYHFMNVEAFKEKIAADEFVEYEEVYPGRFYGTLRRDVTEKLNLGISVVFDVDVKGGINIKKQFGDRAVSFFIQPPSLEALRTRLEGRGTEGQDEIERRLAKASHEMTFLPEFDRIIVNDDLDLASRQIIQIISATLETA
ncbi:MAG: guanylate kinase [Bacteroidia bacterium]|nr:guanylate kinase [Bacteroidia bacterium]